MRGIKNRKSLGKKPGVSNRIIRIFLPFLFSVIYLLLLQYPTRAQAAGLGQESPAVGREAAVRTETEYGTSEVQTSGCADTVIPRADNSNSTATVWGYYGDMPEQPVLHDDDKTHSLQPEGTGLLRYYGEFLRRYQKELSGQYYKELSSRYYDTVRQYSSDISGHYRELGRNIQLGGNTFLSTTGKLLLTPEHPAVPDRSRKTPAPELPLPDMVMEGSLTASASRNVKVRTGSDSQPTIGMKVNNGSTTLDNGGTAVFCAVRKLDRWTKRKQTLF